MTRDDLRAFERRLSILSRCADRVGLWGQPFFRFAWADGAPFTEAEVLRLLAGDDGWVTEVSGDLLVARANLITDAGRNGAAQRLFGVASFPAFGYVGVGSDATAASASDYRLGAATGSSVQINPPDSGFPSVSGNTVTTQATFPANATAAAANFVWRESGVLTSATNPPSATGPDRLLNRKTFGAITKEQVMAIVHGYDIQVG